MNLNNGDNQQSLYVTIVVQSWSPFIRWFLMSVWVYMILSKHFLYY